MRAGGNSLVTAGDASPLLNSSINLSLYQAESHTESEPIHRRMLNFVSQKRARWPVMSRNVTSRLQQ